MDRRYLSFAAGQRNPWTSIRSEALLAQLDKQAREWKDLEIIDRNAERLNREALDTLGYQELP